MKLLTYLRKLDQGCGGVPPPPLLEPAPESRSEGERLGSVLPERSPSGAFLGSAIPPQKMRSLVFEGASRSFRSLDAPKGKKMLPELARMRRKKLFFFVFFGEMTHGKGSLGLAKRPKHSFTPISLILFLISSISLLRGF
jgi:hypothetical protein